MLVGEGKGKSVRPQRNQEVSLGPGVEAENHQGQWKRIEHANFWEVSIIGENFGENKILWESKI